MEAKSYEGKTVPARLGKASRHFYEINCQRMEKTDTGTRLVLGYLILDNIFLNNYVGTVPVLVLSMFSQ